LITIILISTLTTLLGLYITWLVHNQGRFQVVVEPLPEGSQVPIRDQLPLISVIIPARNEARNIRRCIQALLRQTYPHYELIVVDDRSSDETPRILARLAEAGGCLKIVRGTELPEGWAGKPHALVQGAAEAHGEWLCFMDADTFAQPSLLYAAYRKASEHRADMFSILSYQELGTFWERAILPLVFLGLSFGFPVERVNDPARPDAISNGQFILIRRSIYDQIGGHTSVKNRIDEDKALAIAVKRASFRLILADGRKVARTHMYTSLTEMWEGWTKNIYLGLLDRLWLLLFGALLGLLISILLPVWLVGGLVWLASSGAPAAVIVVPEALILWGYLLWKRLQACRVFGIGAWYALTFPLGAFIFTAMMFASAYNVISGRGVSWKGRRYR
jgi:chlorobactene glucosyltransferase